MHRQTLEEGFLANFCPDLVAVSILHARICIPQILTV